MVVARAQPTIPVLLEMGTKIRIWLFQMVSVVEISCACVVWRNSCPFVHSGVFPGNRPAL